MITEDLKAQQKPQWNQWDATHSWHAYTQMQEYLGIPQIHIEYGKGCWLYDSDGRRYLDGNASIWTNVHGHSDPDLNRALHEQLEKVAHSTWLGLSHPVGCKLMERLTTHAPNDLTRVVFSDNGSTAIEVALKLCFQYWQLVGQPNKISVVHMDGAYHGDTFGAMSVSDSAGFHERFQHWLFKTKRFPRPSCQEYGGKVYTADDTHSLEALEQLLETEAANIACLIIEPSIQGAAGMRLQPPGFLKKLETLCRRYDVLLILDEVFVGFGRLGSLFVCESEGICPDLLCLSKGLAAGYLPLAATLTTEKLYKAFLGPFTEYRTFFHGHTFTANPLAAAVALKSLEKLNALIESGHLNETLHHFAAALADAFSGHPHVREIRQRGLTAALDLYPGSDSTAAYPPEERKGLNVCLEARRHGLLIRPLGDTLVIVPPIVIQPDEIDYLIQALIKAMKTSLG